MNWDIRDRREDKGKERIGRNYSIQGIRKYRTMQQGWISHIFHTVNFFT